MPELAQEYKTKADIAIAPTDGMALPEDDPLLCKTPLPLRQVFFPLGFAVEIETNSPQVLDAATESWRGLRQRHAGRTLKLRIGVVEAGPVSCPPAPVARARGHLMSLVADSHNQAVCDLKEGFAFAWLNRGAMLHSSYLRYHFLESLALVLLSTSHVVAVHAAAVSRYGRGMLLCGASGAGKSSLAYGCARAGWTYTTDDASYLLRDADRPRVIGNSHQFRFRPSAQTLFPELSGRSLTPRARGKPSIEVPTSEMENILSAEEATIHNIVFLNRRPSSSAQLKPLSRNVAIEYFRQHVYPEEVIGLSQTVALEQLSAVDTYELRYSDLARAVAQLDRLARGEVGGSI